MIESISSWYCVPAPQVSPFRVFQMQLLCETDFASRSPSYMKAAIELAAAAYQHPITSSQGLVGNEAFGTWLESAPVKEKMEGLAFTLREKVEIRRVASVAADIVGLYPSISPVCPILHSTIHFP